MWPLSRETGTRTTCQSRPARITSCWMQSERPSEDGTLWVTNPPATSWKEPVPTGTLNPAATVHPPPDRVEPRHLTEEEVPTAWSDKRTNGLALTQALCQKRASPVPWGMVREGIGDAVQARWLELVKDSGPVDCTYDQAVQVVLEKPKVGTKPPPPPKHAPAVLDTGQVQDLADRVPDLLGAGRGGGAAVRGVGECEG